MQVHVNIPIKTARNQFKRLKPNKNFLLASRRSSHYTFFGTMVAFQYSVIVTFEYFVFKKEPKKRIHVSTENGKFFRL